MDLKRMPKREASSQLYLLIFTSCGCPESAVTSAPDFVRDASAEA